MLQDVFPTAITNKNYFVAVTCVLVEDTMTHCE